MSRLTTAIRARRSRREIERAIVNAASPALRDELIIAVQTYGSPMGR